MSRLCRLKTASHGDDGKWAYDEIVSLRKQRDLAVEALERIAQNKYSGLSTASIPPLDQRAIWAEHTLSTIKESEAMEQGEKK